MSGFGSASCWDFGSGFGSGLDLSESVIGRRATKSADLAVTSSAICSASVTDLTVTDLRLGTATELSKARRNRVTDSRGFRMSVMSVTDWRGSHRGLMPDLTEIGNLQARRTENRTATG